MTGDIAVLNDLLGPNLAGIIEVTFRQFDWAEDEIRRAMRKHQSVADDIFHAFKVIRPTHDRMATYWVYESHARELLTRVATGADTRPPTWAEITCACSEASMIAPMTGAGAGLYFRAWAKAFPRQRQPIDEVSNLGHYEALHGSAIDDMEIELRRKLAVDDRIIGPVECCGKHWGEAVRCRYARAAAVAA